MAVTPKRTIKNLIDSEVHGDITLYNPKFENDDNVITKRFLKERITELIDSLDNDLASKLATLINEDVSITKSLKDKLIIFLARDNDVKAAFKSTLLSLILSDEDIQNAIKLLFAWIFKND